MTAATPSAARPSSRLRYLPIAVAASAIHLLMMIAGYSEDGSLQVGPWLLGLLISLVVSVLVFTLVVPNAGALTSLVLGVLAVLSILVFWAGITLPLAAAAAVAGWRARQRGDQPRLSITAVVLAAAAAMALVAIIVADAVAT